MKLSVVMIVKNEADNLKLSLPALKGLADEIIILDSGSSDDSKQIAVAHGAQWHENSDWQGFGVQRQRAQAFAQGKWILALDADEVVTAELADSIRTILAQPPAKTVYGIKRLDYVFGKRIDHPKWRIKAHWRLYPANFHYNDNPVHESVNLDGAQTAVLDGYLEHHTAPDPAFWLHKRLEYALTWAKDRHQRGKHVSPPGVWLRSVWAFFKQYLADGRFLQGKYGFIYATLFAEYTFNKYALLYDLNHRAQSYENDFQPHNITVENMPSPQKAADTRKATLSVVMIVKNEQKHLPACLASLADLADEIILLDSGSSDATKRIAEHYGAKWHINTDWPGFGRQRQIAQQYASSDYVLALDADEQPNEALIAAIKDLLAKPVVTDKVFALRRQNIFCGTAVHGNAWYYDQIVRLYAREHFSYHPFDVHESVDEQGAEVITLNGYLRHYTNDNLYHFLLKNIRYSQIWAQEKYSAGKKSPNLASVPFRTCFSFIREYILRGAFLGGAYGLFLSAAASFYNLNKYIILYHLKQSD
ncbi:glycosyltransferase family 2 protein [Cardiobacteriaceae bacterium TAE3-ERU3]|nr:glycosyltransferase family 2 protein [Cardiobacteriaceae bacterium TAE3-ERU3]